MEEATGAPSSFAACSPRRLRASSRDGGGVMNRPPSPLTMLLSRHTRRREFISFLASATAAAAGDARAQSSEMRRVGILMGARLPPLATLRQALRNLGHREGENIRFEERFAEDNEQRYPALASELAAIPVDVIVTWGTPATSAAKR